MSRIALTTSGEDLSAPLDPRFGRTARFLIYDLETEAFELLDNEMNKQAAQGAGIQAAQTVVDAGVQGVITGHCGPKAFRVLEAAEIQVYLTDAETVADAIGQLKDGDLKPTSAADVEGHW